MTAQQLKNSILLMAVQGKLVPQDLHQKVAIPTRRLQKTRVDSRRLILHQIEHRLDQPRRG